MLNIPRVAQYARFSSDNQRTESIDAQIRAMNQYCKQNHWQVVAVYRDEAKSATTDNRPQFQQMISDSSKNLFDIVLVHKVDRFSRNRYDSAIYKKKLKDNNVTLCSVLERIDDSPEGVIMESLLEAMAEYYSKNLSRETIKGLRETAFQCKHTGGSCPLGFDLDSERRLVVNPHEAEAVRIIFEMFAAGHGYSEIIDVLNSRGFRTKKGKIFGKNSLYEILRNEKYTGVYVFNKVDSKDANGKRNSNRLKEEEKVIRIEGGCPQIISKALFEKVQRIKAKNKRDAGRFHSSEFYLLTGKIVCGVCGKRMVGNVRFSGRNKTRLATYRCPTHKSECRNKEINKVYLDSFVAVQIADRILTPNSLRKVIRNINKHIQKYNSDYNSNHETLSEQYNSVIENLRNITDAIEKGFITESVIERAEQLENERALLETKLRTMHLLEPIEYSDYSYLIKEWKNLTRNTVEFRSFVQQFVNTIRVFPFHLEIEFDVSLGAVPNLTETIKIRRGELYQLFESKVKE